MKISSNLILRCGRKEATLGVTCSQQRRNNSTFVGDPVSVEALNGARPFKDIPGPKSLPLIGNLHRYLPKIGEYSTSKWHEAGRLKYKQYGSIVREEIVPGVNLVHLYDPKDMEAVHRHEAVTYILFKQRMGCLDDNLAPESMAQKYIQALNDFFNLTSKVELSSIPVWRIFPRLSPSFQKLKNVHDFFFENAMQFVKVRLDEIEKGNLSDEEESLLHLLLKSCSARDACVVAVDTMAGGIDTTSLTFAYVLRNLAANPEAQKTLQAEVDRVLPNGKPLTVQAIDDMPYLRACIKESMRMTPTVQGTSRTLDKDIVLSGYRIPANTRLLLNYYVTSIQEQYFPDASKYKPERWLRSSSGGVVHNFAFQPFGFGPRMCIGRRIADLEMLTLLTKVIQNFWVENNNDELDINFQLVLMIKSPLRYEFHERRQ